jgi:predicted metalloendopeptidase
MFVKKLKKTSWMDKSVIELAIEKVHKIVQKIGYPTEVCEALLAQHHELTLTVSSLPISWTRKV